MIENGRNSVVMGRYRVGNISMCVRKIKEREEDREERRGEMRKGGRRERKIDE